MIAVNGKTLRGSGHGSDGSGHLLAALDHAHGVVLGQVEVGANTNEIPLFTTLLDRLDIQDAVITSIPTIGWLFLLQVIAAFGLAVICRGNRQPAGRRRRPVRAVHPRRHAATSRLTGRQSRMPRVPAAAAGCRAGVAVCRSGHLSVGVSPDAGPRVPHWPRSSGHARPGQCRARESSQCGRPVAGRSVAGPSGPGRAEQPRRIPAAAPLLAAGVTLGVHMSGTSRPGPARLSDEFSHRPAGPLCSSSSQMTLRGLALCGCS